MSKRRPRAATPTVAVPSPGYSITAFRAAVAESVAQPTAERISVREATMGTQPTGTGRLAIRLIRAGWSLNGNYYPAEVLRRDGPAAWPKGTQAFVDHATDEEDRNRPAGSVRNLAAVLTTDARWDEAEQALMAEARLFHPWRETLTDMSDTIGMSIRAWVTGQQGEAEGREGFVIDSIPEGRSVDFVTVPAAGGGIVSVLESVSNQVPADEARNAGHWFEARIHSHFSQLADEMFGEGFLDRGERITLSGAVGDALAAFAARIEADAPHLYDRDPYDEPAAPVVAMADEAALNDGEPSADSDPEPDEPATPDVTDGVPPTAPNTPTSEEEPDMSGPDTGTPPVQAGTAADADTPTTSTSTSQESVETVRALEAVTAQLATMQAALAAVTARADQRDAENRALRNQGRATEAVNQALGAPEHADVAAQIGSRVASRVLACLPTTGEGAVDEARLAETITAVIADEATHVRVTRAQALVEAGVGLPRGLGAAPAQEANDGIDDELSDFFGNVLGLSEQAAQIAVKGRN